MSAVSDLVEQLYKSRQLPPSLAQKFRTAIDVDARHDILPTQALSDPEPVEHAVYDTPTPLDPARPSLSVLDIAAILAKNEPRDHEVEADDLKRHLAMAEAVHEAVNR